jgi:hypothetical protein
MMTDGTPRMGCPIYHLYLGLTGGGWGTESDGRRVPSGTVFGKVPLSLTLVASGLGSSPASTSCVSSTWCTGIDPCRQLVDGHMEAGDIVIPLLGGSLWSSKALPFETLVFGLKGSYNCIPVH